MKAVFLAFRIVLVCAAVPAAAGLFDEIPPSQTGVGTGICMAYRQGRWVAEPCAPPPPLSVPTAAINLAPPIWGADFRAASRHALDGALGVLSDELRLARDALGANPDYGRIVIPALERILSDLPAPAGRTGGADEALDAINDLYARLHGWRAAYHYQELRLPHLKAQEEAVRRDTAVIRDLWRERAGELSRWQDQTQKLRERERRLDGQTTAMSQMHGRLEASLRPVVRRVLERFGEPPTDDVFLGLSDSQRRELAASGESSSAAMPAEEPWPTFPLSVDDPRRSGVVDIPSLPNSPPVGLDIDRRTLTAKALQAAAGQTVALAGEVARSVERHVETVRTMERVRQACGAYNGAAADWAGLAVERDSVRKAYAQAAADESESSRRHAWFRFDAYCELARNGLWAYFDLESADLARMAGVDAGAARSMDSLRERIIRFARAGMSYLPTAVREVGSLTPGQQGRLESSLNTTVCEFARDIQLEAAQAPSFLKPLFGKVNCGSD